MEKKKTSSDHNANIHFLKKNKLTFYDFTRVKSTTFK